MKQPPQLAQTYQYYHLGSGDIRRLAYILEVTSVQYCLGIAFQAQAPFTLERFSAQKKEPSHWQWASYTKLKFIPSLRWAWSYWHALGWNPNLRHGDHLGPTKRKLKPLTIPSQWGSKIATNSHLLSNIPPLSMTIDSLHSLESFQEKSVKLSIVLSFEWKLLKSKPMGFEAIFGLSWMLFCWIPPRWYLTLSMAIAFTIGQPIPIFKRSWWSSQ